MKKRVHTYIVLDRSGSMGGSENNTIKAINDYVEGLAKDGEISSRVSLTLFDSIGIDMIADTVKAKDFTPLNRITYVPRQSTPLYDAIGETVDKIDAAPRREGENVVLVILTDGLENSSRKFTNEQIDKLLKDRQDNKNWLVIYLGAEHDALAQGSSIGTVSANTVQFDKANFMQAASYMTRSTSDFAKTSLRASGAATAGERASMVAEKKKPDAKAPVAK